jgi:hypothetical protein
MIGAKILDRGQIGSFSFRWPDFAEDFEGGWMYQLSVSGQTHNVRYGLGGRPTVGSAFAP